MEYFSDKEQGKMACIENKISPEVWGAIVAHVETLISTGAFGEHFPDNCPDVAAEVIGTDKKN